MIDKKRKSWREFQKLTIDRKNLSKRAKKAETATVRHAHKFIIGRWNNIKSVRRHVVGWLLLVGLLIGVVGIQLSWFQRSYSTMAPVEGGTYAEATLGPIESLNPLYATTSAELAASELLFSRLYSYDTTGRLKGDIATTTTTNDEATVYRVSLRNDAKWHDGTRLTAKDVVYTVNLLRDPLVRSAITGWDDITARALDDTTVEFTLPAAYASFDHALTFPILPEHILNDVAPSGLRESVFSQSPVGSGPFQLRYFQTINTAEERKIVHLGKNEAYYRGAPKLSRFQLHSFGSKDAILRSLRTNEVNAAVDFQSDRIDDINQERYEIISKPVNNGVYALFNNSNEILKDRQVRKALQLGTDTAKIRSQLPTEVRALDLPFISGQIGEKDVPAAPDADTDRAKQILEDAGWKMGANNVRSKGETTLKVKITSLQGSEYEKVLTALTEQWRDLGVAVEAQVISSGDDGSRVVQDYLQPRNYDVLLYEMAIGADPDVYAYWHSSQSTMRGRNFANYKNDLADDALSSARSRTETDLRNAKYVSFAKQWLEDAPAIALYQPVTLYAHSRGSNTVQETTRLISSRDRYSDVVYWTVNNSPVYKTP